MSSKKIDINFANSIFNRELKYLKDSIKNSKNSYHFFSFSSINNDKPEQRTVVLRDVHHNPLSIFFNTDNRSPKIQELNKNSNTSILFYDNKRRVQLRLNCKANIHHNNQLTNKIWMNTALQSKKCYMAPYFPGEKLSEWKPNLPEKYINCDPTDKDSQIGYKNFSIVELKVNTFEIIELHYDGHIRFKVNIDNENKINFIAS